MDIILRPIDEDNFLDAFHLKMTEEQEKTGMAVVYAGNKEAVLTAPKGIPSAVKLTLYRFTLHRFNN